MDHSEQIIQSIYLAIDEVNEMLDPDEKIDKAPQTVLLGEGGNLDSTGFVTFTVEIEKHIERTFHKSISLMDVIEITDDSPFTVAMLADFISGMID